LTNALGHGVNATVSALRNRCSGLRKCDFEGTAGLDTWIGHVDGVNDIQVPSALGYLDCRNNRLAQLALEQDEFTATVSRCISHYGHDRIGLFLGTSTSGIHETELAYIARNDKTGSFPAGFDYRNTQVIFSVVDFVRQLLNLHGPSLSISTACSSSAKVFAAAYRYMRTGMCDAAIVGGIDSLCLTTLYGFSALELVSSTPCRPWDAGRDGINIGEAAGFSLLEWDNTDSGNIVMKGYGESSDAYHIASPHPQGKGASQAMQDCLDMAGINSTEVDYINLHGTATPSNDASEDAALRHVFTTPPPFSSTKGWTGHTLGAAGITEAIITCLSIDHGFMPGTLNTGQPDPALSEGVLLDNRHGPVNYALSNSFGFGGSNCSLLFSRRTQ
jgi:3-oxoacyl-[acyl-carrier-protein] synthase-1